MSLVTDVALDADVNLRLPSGLTVVIERMEADEVVIEHRVRVGAAHEAEDGRGAAHLVEHLLFPDTFSHLVHGRGGQTNAWTAVDATVYRTVVPPEALADVLAVEATRFAPHAFTAGAVQREVAVTGVERALRIDLAEGLSAATERLGQLLPGHPYGRAVAPEPDVIRALDLADAQAFFDRWYRAERITVVIAGPVDPPALAARIGALYGAVPKGAPADPFVPLDRWEAPPEVRGSELPNAVAWRVPGRDHPDAAALHWIAALSPALDLLQWESGGLLYLRVARPGQVDAAAWKIRQLSAEWIAETALAGLQREAQALAPPWSPGAWVDAWGVTPGPATREACAAAWDRWVREPEPVRLVGED